MGQHVLSCWGTNLISVSWFQGLCFICKGVWADFNWHMDASRKGFPADYCSEVKCWMLCTVSDLNAVADGCKVIICWGKISQCRFKYSAELFLIQDLHFQPIYTNKYIPFVRQLRWGFSCSLKKNMRYGTLL